MHLSEMLLDRIQASLEDRIGLPESQEHLGAGRGQLAVAQVRDLGVVNTAEIEGIREGWQHLVGPAIALVPHMDQVRHRPTALIEPIPVTLGHMIRNGFSLRHLIRILIGCKL